MKSVLVSVMVMPWKLTISRYTSGKTPIRSSTKIAGPTSRYLKLRCPKLAPCTELNSHPHHHRGDEQKNRSAANAPIFVLPRTGRASYLGYAPDLAAQALYTAFCFSSPTLAVVSSHCLATSSRIFFGSSPAHRRLMPWRSASSYLSVWISDRSSRPVCDPALSAAR